MLTSSSLNKILSNRRLNQKEKEILIRQCLSNRMSEKGYAKIYKEKIQLKVSHQKSKLFSSSRQGNKYNIREINTMKYTYSICYDDKELKIEQDSSNLYPLATYLTLYKEKANLQVVDLLWLNILNKKDIKKRYYLFQHEQIQKKQLTVDVDTNAYKELEVLYHFYQPLWNIMTFIAHGDIFQHLLNKFYINISRIRIDKIR